LPREGALLQPQPAELQMLNWNDLRYVLAISRGRTLAAAARLLGVDDTTVARRLVAVQEAIGARLYQRLADGTLQLTTSGERAALHAERMEREICALDGALTGADDVVSGTVRITSVPIIVNHILVPAAQILLQRHPKLQLEFVADARDLSLTRGETDLALRLARPKTGGTKVMARRVGTMRYDVYASASYSARDAKVLPWITYDEAMAYLPQARWIAATAVRSHARIAAVHVNDAEALLEAVIAGLGRSLLPCVVADGDPRLRRIGVKRGVSLLSRELWLLKHSELRRLGRIEAVVKWIEQIAPL
jgi:DNA-binding transcriptional LysR family regulator